MAATAVATPAAGATFGDATVRSAFDGDVLVAFVSLFLIVRLVVMSNGSVVRDLVVWSAGAAQADVREQCAICAQADRMGRQRMSQRREAAQCSAALCSAVEAVDTAPVAGQPDGARHRRGPALRLLMRHHRSFVTASGTLRWRSG